MDTDAEVLEKPAKQRQRQQQQQVVKTKPGVLVVGSAAVDAGVGVGDAAEGAVGVRSSSSRVLEVCVEPPGGGAWAVIHLQLSQVSMSSVRAGFVTCISRLVKAPPLTLQALLLCVVCVGCASHPRRVPLGGSGVLLSVHHAQCSVG